MNARSRILRSMVLLAAAAGLLIEPRAEAKGGKGGHSGGHAAAMPRPPRYSAPKIPAYHPPRMAHAAAPARMNTSSVNAKANQNHGQSIHGTQGTANRANSARVAASTRSASRASRNSHALAMRNTYTYGNGNSARHYRAYGYGRGFRNRYSGNNYGYGRSQGNNRAIVSRLRSVHASLARLDHDYQGHRVRAMHATSMAIRQLSHRSMVYRGVGFSNGVNNGMAMGMRRNNNNGMNQGRRQPMTQAQSDSRMSQALRSLQGVQMQMSQQGYVTTSLSRAHGHVQTAMKELGTALRIR